MARILRAYAVYLVFVAGMRTGIHQEDMATYILLGALLVTFFARQLHSGD